MENTLFEEFINYKNIGQEKLKNTNKLNPTTILPLIQNGKIDFEESDTLKKLNKNKDNSVKITNAILDNISINQSNMSVLKFIFHELIGNIYDHSEFKDAYIMGKSHSPFYDFSFIDDGISIPISLRNNAFEFKNDCEAIIKAMNGLSTKTELGYIERGT